MESEHLLDVDVLASVVFQHRNPLPQSVAHGNAVRGTRGRAAHVHRLGRCQQPDGGHRLRQLENPQAVPSRNLMVVFRGDLESLRARYSISFDSDGENWTLDLEPRSRALRGIIERIRFTGQGRKLTAMETRESNGDRTIMRFSEIEIDLSWEQGDLDRIFSLDPPDATP